MVHHLLVFPPIAVVRGFILLPSTNNNYMNINNDNNLYFRIFPTGGNTELQFASSVAVVTCSDPVAKRTRCCLWRRTCSDSVWIGSDPVLVRSWFLV